MDERVQELADTIKNALQKLCQDAEIKSYMNGYKIVSVIGTDDVRTRIAEPHKPRQHRKTLSETEVKKMKEIKKNFKDNLDLSNLLILLIRVREELNKVNMKKVPKEKLEIVMRTVSEVSKELNTRLLEMK